MDKLENFLKARNVLRPVLNDTKLILSDYLSKAYGTNIYLKPENLQKTGAFKIRGAYYKVSTLTEEEKARGLITASAGNHAQGVAYAAREQNVKATIVMPLATPLVKINNTKNYGAEVILYGDNYDESCNHALELAEENGYTFIHPFDDLQVATGQGTIAYEILEDLPNVDIVIVPVGGGGLIAGVSTLFKMINPNIKIIGVEPSGAASMITSLEKGEVTTLDKINTIADGVAVKTPGKKVFPYIQENVSEMITIDDGELVDVFLGVVENNKLLVENSGLLTVAALNHIDVKGKNVVCLLSGGNMDVITISSLVQHGLINRGRVCTISVLLPDKSGELSKVSALIARENGNIVKLEHNQFVSINRNIAVELIITIETFGHEHKESIIKALVENNYLPELILPSRRG